MDRQKLLRPSSPLKTDNFYGQPLTLEIFILTNWKLVARVEGEGYNHTSPFGKSYVYCVTRKALRK